MKMLQFCIKEGAKIILSAACGYTFQKAKIYHL